MVKRAKYVLIVIVQLAHFLAISKEYNIEYLTSEQGLSQNEVTTILQDRDGFMWFGTRGGLNRYDGYDFIHYKPKANSRTHLSNPSIEIIFEDSKGDLWIGTKSGGLNFYKSKTEQFSQIKSLKGKELKADRIICFAETHDEKILVGTWSDGIYVIDKQNNTLRHVFDNIQVNDILIYDKEWAWIGTNQGFYKLNLSDLSFHRIKLSESFNITECVFDEQENKIWLVGWECGLISFSPELEQWERYILDKENTPGPNNTYSLLIDSKNNIWVGTWNFGLFQFDRHAKNFKSVKLESGIGEKYNSNYSIILDIYEDSTQNIWIGTDSGGIIKLGTSKPFRGVSLEKNPNCGLTNFNVNSFWKSDDNILYLGTRGGGLFKTKDNVTFEAVSVDKTLKRTIAVKDIFPISEDKLWISYDDKCYELDITDENAIISAILDQNINQIRKITAIKKSSNSLLIGTQQEGLYYFPDINKTDTFKHFTPQNNKNLLNERITFIEQDSNADIWVGTFKGVYKLNLNEEEIIPVALSPNQFLTGDIISCWHQSNDSIFWIGTPNGVNKLTRTRDGKYTVKHFDKESGLPDDYILGILSSNNEEIWLSTNSGIVKMLIEDECVYSFDKSDGLSSLNFSESKGYLAKDGTLYFGNTDGYTYFKSKDIKINEKIPPVVLTKFKIFNTEIKPFDTFNGTAFLKQSVHTQPEIHLSYKEKEFTIEFSALNYNSPQRNQYAYKLEGYDESWVQAGTKRSVTYINLKPGEYIFRVRGSNNNYVWNMEGTSLPLVIHPAPWKTWYAIILYVLLITGVVVLIKRNAVKQVRLANKLEMEQVKNEQEHLLNEMKLRFFTNISHEFRTPLTLILGPIQELVEKNKDSKQIKVIYKNAKRLLTLVNQLLEFRRVEMDTLKLKASRNNVTDFLKEICISFEELAKINNIEFKTNFSVKTNKLWFDVEKMEIVLNNIISNAFKYSGEKAVIEVNLSETEKTICFHVVDNGPGIDINEIDRIFDRFYQSKDNPKYGSSGIGLHLVKQMVELHKGEISVVSEPNVRTEFIVQLHKGKKHLSQDEMVESVAIQHPSGFYEKDISNNISTIPKNYEPTDKRKSVLVVEDNPEIREYLNELLINEFEVSLAGNGREGYQKAIEREYDLVISDIMMPEVDGLEMCKMLKTSLETSHIPVILLTAKSAGQFRLEGLSYGAEAYISKPFNPEELIAQVHSILIARQKVKERFGKTITLEPTELEITSHEEQFIESVLKTIENNIENSEFKSEDLAKQVGVSVTTLYRKLKSLTGQSSNEIIRSVRLKRAGQLLKESSQSVSEIAYMTGFNDVKYFRKCFQKQFGKNPTEFRNV